MFTTRAQQETCKVKKKARIKREKNNREKTKQNKFHRDIQRNVTHSGVQRHTQWNEKEIKRGKIVDKTKQEKTRTKSHGKERNKWSAQQRQTTNKINKNARRKRTY